MPPCLEPHRAAYDVLVTARLFARLATRHDGSRSRPMNFAGRQETRNPEAQMRLRPFSSRERGMFISIDGPSGAGKSTIVRHLAQMLVIAGGLAVAPEPSTGRSACCAAS